MDGSENMDGLIQNLADYLTTLPDDTNEVPFSNIEKAIGLQLPNESKDGGWWQRFQLLSNSNVEFGEIGPSRRDQHCLSVIKYSQLPNYKGLARNKEVFFERWSLTKQEDNFPVILQRVLNECTDFFIAFSSDPDYLRLFCTLLGKSLPDWRDDRAQKLYQPIAKTKDIIELAYLLQMLFNILKHFENYQAMKELKLNLLKVLDITVNPPFFLDTDIVNGEINIYKSGAELLDQELVNYCLHWLTKYPEVRMLFSKALKSYSKDNLTDVEARSVYDDLRASLEKLIKLILGNSDPLEKNRKIIAQWLTDKGVHTNVVAIFKHIMNQYIEFMNDAKHVNKYNSNDLEFMIYQTAIMMRMLLEKKRS
jgi:hypothetical protein